MKTVVTNMLEFKQILEQKEAELLRMLRNRNDIAIEPSPDQMDSIQYATERDLAIGSLDRESKLLREIKAALRRIRDGSFGTCIVCESSISPKRLGAVPWAPRCIQCQDAADRDRGETNESFSGSLSSAA